MNKVVGIYFFVKNRTSLKILANALCEMFQSSYSIEFVFVTIRNPAFCLALYLTGVYFRGELQHFGKN